MSMIDNVLGLSPQVLAIRSQRTEMIAANLANADTPGYKAMDMDFAQSMAAARDSSYGLKTTSKLHFKESDIGSDIRYRVPTQPSLDGNTVESDVEHGEFMENAIRYQASLNFLDGRIKGILLALKGE